MLTARGCRPLQRPLAFATVEAREMAAAGKRCPDHAVGVDVDAARCVADHAGGWIERWLVSLAHARLRIDADDPARHRPWRGPPGAAVARMGNDAVDDADGHLPIDRRIDLAVLVQIVPGAAPALGLGFI